MSSVEEAKKPSAISWTVGLKNALNVRVSFRRSTIVSTGPFETERGEWSVELDCPSDVTIDDLQDDLGGDGGILMVENRAPATSGKAQLGTSMAACLAHQVVTA